MSSKFANIGGFLILGAILFGTVAVIVANFVPGADLSTVGKWASFGGAIAGALYGGTRK